MYKKIDHIGIAVSNLEDSIARYRKLGLEPKNIETVAEQKVTVAMFPVGESKIELIQALTEDSPIAKFIARKGDGIHHIAFAVDNIENELQNLLKAGVTLVDTKARIGAGGVKVAFVHPKETCGALVELVEQ